MMWLYNKINILVFAGKLTAAIEGPNGKLPADVLKTEVGRYSLKFTPQAEGQLKS
jgi:hypothetical protein